MMVGKPADEYSLGPEELVLGIDGGASKCRASLVNKQNEVLGTGLAKSVNPTFSMDETFNSVVESSMLALASAKEAYPQIKDLTLAELHAGIGYTGVNVPSVCEKLLAWKSPFKQKQITTDTRIACLGAHEGGDGGIVIIGTGSCGIVIKNGQSSILGGHGFPQGDVGSGAWFGLKAVESVLLSEDGLGSKTSMTESLYSQLNITNTTKLIQLVASKPSNTFATMAKNVFECALLGDDVALAILREGVAYLDNLIATLSEQGQLPIALIGGLSQSIKDYLSPESQRILVEPKYPPEVGAAIFARAQQY